MTARSELLTQTFDRLGRMSATTLAAWVAFTCVLVMVPVAASLSRESRFIASIAVMSGDEQVSSSALATSVRRLVEPPKPPSEPAEDAPAKPLTEEDARLIVDEATLADRTTATPTARGVVASVWGGTPAEAARLGNLLVQKLEKATTRAGSERIVLGTSRVTSPNGFVDRTVDALPGPFPRRPDPVWAGLAGLLVAVAFMGAALFLHRPDLRSRSPRELHQNGVESVIDNGSH